MGWMVPEMWISNQLLRFCSKLFDGSPRSLHPSCDFMTCSDFLACQNAKASHGPYRQVNQCTDTITLPFEKLFGASHHDGVGLSCSLSRMGNCSTYTCMSRSSFLRHASLSGLCDQYGTQLPSIGGTRFVCRSMGA